MKTLILAPHGEDGNLSGSAALFRRWQTHFEQALPAEHPKAPILSLSGRNVNRRIVDHVVTHSESNHVVDFVVYLGHGLSCCLLTPPVNNGRNKHCDNCLENNACSVQRCDHVILDEGNFQNMEGRLIFMFACNSARRLGQALRGFNDQQSGFFGFNSKIYLSGNHPATNMLRDTLTKVFRILHRRDGISQTRYAQAGRVFLDAMIAGLIESEKNQDPWGMFFFSHLQRHFIAHPN